MAAGGLIEVAIEAIGFSIEVLLSGNSTLKEKFGCLALLILVIVLIGGIIWYLNTGNDTVLQTVPEIIEE